MTIDTTRRAFVVGATAGSAALFIGFGATGSVVAASSHDLVANPFVTLHSDGRVTVIIKHIEFGQGTATGLATLVAEELDADWTLVQTAFAPAEPRTYANLKFGMMGTGGSTAMANSFAQYRRAGATARDLLVRAAAAEWTVPASEIAIADGTVSHPSGRSSGFGPLVARASELTPSPDAPLKPASAFRLIGRDRLERKDGRAKTDGSAIFASDVRLPNMVVAVISRPPKFGAKLVSVDDRPARSINGVVDVKTIPQGIVVYARNTWAALKGRAALVVEWETSTAELRSSDAIIAEAKRLLGEPGLVVSESGDVEAELQRADQRLSADFTFPFLAHAPMEPLACVIRFDGRSAEVWDGCQFPSVAQPSIGRILMLKPEDVKINTLYAGGSFGRRATPEADYHCEAAEAVKAIDGRFPVKLIWTREDDITGGHYRPIAAHRIEAGLDTQGNIVGWRHALAVKSILKGTPFEAIMVRNGIDATSVEGARELPYAIGAMRVDVRDVETRVPALWWRAVGHTHTAFSTEIMIDMLAEVANQDPVAFRRKLLAAHPRHLGVLELAAEKSAWGTPLGPNRGRGIAVHESFSSYVAEVVEVSVRDGGAIKVDRVVCAVDCGLVVNPDVVRAQMEGGIGYGLGAAMRNKITLTGGAVDQVNFHDYEPLRLSDMPAVEVHMVASTQQPTGVGEPGTPPIAPALANAIFAATGKRVFDLPFTDTGITFA
ncbi:MAG: molybdopterin cofactor-binding domain-containing protein [Hyphomicrobiaceae bacterium]